MTDLAPHPHLLSTIEGAVQTLTLNQPDKHNAQTPSLWAALADAAENLAPDIRVVVLRGAGPSFSAGIDRAMFTPQGVSDEVRVTELVAAGDDSLDEAIADFQRGFTAWSKCSAVVIAAVHGHAIGAGLQLALAADLRVVTESAQLAMRETSLGLVPDLGGTGPLVRLVGYPRALELCATGRAVNGAEAVQIGLANHVVPDAALDAGVEQLTQALLAAPDAALRALKPLLRSAEYADPATQLAAERAAQAGLLKQLLT